jgi:PAS domain-containing protein
LVPFSRVQRTSPFLAGTVRQGSLAMAQAPIAPGCRGANLPVGWQQPLDAPDRLATMERELPQARLQLQEAQRVEAEALDLGRQWMHATPVGMALCDPGNHSVVETSAAFCIFWARSPAGLIASPCQDLLPPDDRNGDGPLALELMLGRQEPYRIQKLFVRPDGAVGRGDFSIVAIRDGNGSLRQLLKQIIAITELMHVQAQLKEQQLQLRTNRDKLQGRSLFIM